MANSTSPNVPNTRADISKLIQSKQIKAIPGNPNL